MNIIFLTTEIMNGDTMPPTRAAMLHSPIALFLKVQTTNIYCFNCSIHNKSAVKILQ